MPSTPSNPTQPSNAQLIFFLGFINALTPFTIDLYLPAFSDIALELGTTAARVSLSLATYFIGYAFGQILWGPLLDRFGRKPPIYIGLAIYIAGTIGCMTAGSVESLMFFRFVSAIGGSAASVGAVSMVLDYFPQNGRARVFSMLMLVLSASPLFAPTIGAWLAAHWGWRTIFGSLIGLAVVDLFIVAFCLPKNYEPDKSVSLRLGPIMRNFIEIVQVRQFRAYAFAGAFSFAGLFVYLAGSPAIFIDGFHVSKQTYGLIFAVLAMGIIGGGQVNNWLLRRFDNAYIYRRAIKAQAMISFTFLFATLTMQLNMGLTIIFFFLILLCVGIGYPNAPTMALATITKNTGSASSLLGFFQISTGAVLAAIGGLIGLSGTLPTATVMAVSAFISLTILVKGTSALKSAKL